jgi:TonB family protein
MTTIVQCTLAAAFILLLLCGTAHAERKPLLSVAEANRAAAKYAEQVKRCYFRHGLAAPSASGKVRVDLDVKSSGNVRRVRVLAPGIARRDLERCVVAHAMAWRFPASRQPTEVRMPFYFQVPIRLRTATVAQRTP